MGSYRQPMAYFAGLGEAYQKQSRPKEALVAWLAVETLKPDYPQLQLRLGEAHLGLGRPDRASESFQRALAQQPNSPDLYFALAELARQRGESREAMQQLLKVTQLNPKHGLAWLWLGQLAEQARLPQEAQQAYKRAVALLPTDSADRRLAQQQLQRYQPALPDTLVAGWPEFIRQMTGPMTLCLLALLLDSGLRPWWIPWTGWLALLLAFIGIFLTVSGGPLPRNPLIRLILGQEEGGSKELRLVTLIIGLGCCFMAVTLILWPLQGQAFPKIPPLPHFTR
jgi:tetratricopeptide (TPR) repeat protein